jgi:hypothetical protein
MSYAVFFDKDNETIRLPVNPESITITKAQNIETYNVLKLGKIAKASDSELDKYSFEVELPGTQYGYVLTAGDFKPADFYLKKFEAWREDKKPVRFIKSNGQGDDLSTLVLVESFDIVENAGEEGDYYVSFKLTEYKPFGKKEVFISSPKASTTTLKTASTTTKQKAKVTTPSRDGIAPKPKTYTISSGDTLWGISKRFLGDGAKYTKIIAANPQIKNPSLIHSGQVINLA